ncbi:MAG: type II secretion system protein [Verrucomicrobiae bacterium]|nr:type II secretion system protein [Verrucomicrobiae bacterium]
MELKKLKASRGFSLVELLVVIAVIGLIAAIALPSVSKITEKARRASAQKNAQSLCTLHTNAKSAGAGFTSTTRDGILDELVVGVTGTIVESDFKMSSLSEDDKTEALKYCWYDGDAGIMNYYPQGNAPEDIGGDGWEASWGYAHPSTVAATVGNLNALNDGFEYRVGGPHENGSTAIDRRPRP